MPELENRLPRIFAAGVGPLPPEDPDRLFAPGIRIWGMARELAARGHPVRLAVARPWGAALDRLYIYDLAGTRLPEPRVELLEGRTLPRALADEARDFGAAAALGSTDLVNHALALADLSVPLWCDFFGDPMAERQMLAWLHESDDGLADQWGMLAAALARADRVSGCSRRQAGALAGQMATLGRLNRLTAEARLAVRIPPWIEPIPPEAGTAPLLRGEIVPADAVIIAQSGGFNTWLDAETLHAALEIIMRRRADVHFAATGGRIPGHNDRTFARFEALVAASPFRDRFHLLGWVPLGRVPRILGEADLAVNVDLPCLEGWHGTRNRLLDWAMAGLPIVSTIGCELAEEMVAAGWIEPSAQGNAAAIAEAVERTLGDLAGCKVRAAKAREEIARRYAAPSRLKPLLDWARDARPAPDIAAWRAGEPPPALTLNARDEAGRVLAIEETESSLAAARSRIAELEGSSLVRGALWLRRFLGRT